MSTQKTPAELYEMYKGRKATLYGATGVVVGYDPTIGPFAAFEDGGAPLIMGLEDEWKEIGWGRDCLAFTDIIDTDCPLNYFLYIDISDITI